MVKLTRVTQVWFTFAWLWCQRRNLPGIRGGDDSCERGLIQMKKVYCKCRLGSGRTENVEVAAVVSEINTTLRGLGGVC